MGNYRSIFTGRQVDDAVNEVLNKGLLSILNGAVYRDNNENFVPLISENEGVSIADITPSLVTRGEKYKWNRMIPLSEKGANNGVAALDSEGKIPIGQIPTDDVALLDENGKISMSLLYGGEDEGVATLDENGQVLTSQLPSYVKDIVEGYKYGEAPDEYWYSDAAHTTRIVDDQGRSLERLTNKIYLDLTDGENRIYRWGGTVYIEISPSLILGETEYTAHRGDHGVAAYTHAVTNKGIAVSEGLYKITTNSEGHITHATAVETQDITSLGISESVTITPDPAPEGAARIATIKIGENSTALYAPYQGMTAVNALNTNGYVRGPTAADGNKVWGTDSSGNPGWIHANTPISQALILGANSWNTTTKEQTINMTGVTATNSIIVSPTPTQMDLYGQYGIICTTQSLGQLTFKCNVLPAEDIVVNILIIE